MARYERFWGGDFSWLSTRSMSYQLAITGAVLMIDVRYLRSDCASYFLPTTC